MCTHAYCILENVNILPVIMPTANQQNIEKCKHFSARPLGILSEKLCSHWQCAVNYEYLDSVLEMVKTLSGKSWARHLWSLIFIITFDVSNTSDVFLLHYLEIFLILPQSSI